MKGFGNENEELYSKIILVIKCKERSHKLDSSVEGATPKLVGWTNSCTVGMLVTEENSTFRVVEGKRIEEKFVYTKS